MLKTKEELEQFYRELTEKFEGYIQMSDGRIKDIFVTPISLPKWEELHNGVNYILEMALFEPNSKKSILVRQANEKWIVLKKTLTNEEIKKSDSFYTIAKKSPKMKIAQIWEEEESEFCKIGEKSLKVLEPKYLLFAGFPNA